MGGEVLGSQREGSGAKLDGLSRLSMKETITALAASATAFVVLQGSRGQGGAAGNSGQSRQETAAEDPPLWWGWRGSCMQNHRVGSGPTPSPGQEFSGHPGQMAVPLFLKNCPTAYQLLQSGNIFPLNPRMIDQISRGKPTVTA